MQFLQSEQLFANAQRCLPGGVNSPVRAFGAVGCTPVFVSRAQGSRIYDVDGHEFLDFIGSWGPMLLGHAHPALIQAGANALARGTSYGLPCPDEVEMAQLMCAAYPGMQMVRMVNSGTEAVMSALRAARAFTQRQLIIKFEGCYHGHSDGLLVQAGSGAMTLGVPTSLGVCTDTLRHTLLCPYNDFARIQQLFEAHANDIAAVILEPVAANMGVVAPVDGFLQLVRNLCTQYGSVLIFDEVITGFRLAFGGAAAYYGITPDMACFGKIIGGGLPVGAYGGRHDIMRMIAPSGGVYQAGTLSGNPMAMAMGLCQLQLLQSHPEWYTQLEERAAWLQAQLEESLRSLHISGCVARVGSLLTLFFTSNAQLPENYAQAKQCNTTRFAAYFRALLHQGILCAPSQFESIFISTAHSKQDLSAAASAMHKALMQVQQS